MRLGGKAVSMCVCFCVRERERDNEMRDRVETRKESRVWERLSMCVCVIKILFVANNSQLEWAAISSSPL